MSRPNYRLRNDCPVCQHAEREEIDANLASYATVYPPVSACGLIGRHFDVEGREVAQHERWHRNPED